MKSKRISWVRVIFYNFIDKRIKIEQRKQVYFDNQKKLIDEYRERKMETENLLRISFQKKPNVNMYTPDFQFTNSYMNSKIVENFDQRHNNNHTEFDIENKMNNNNNEIKQSDELPKTEEINDDQNLLAEFDTNNYNQEDE